MWFNPNAITNILSLHRLSKYYPVRYDSTGDGCFTVHISDAHTLRFRPTVRGLYAYCSDNKLGPAEAFTFVQTVTAQKDKYTKRQIQDADLARKVQNIIGFKNDRQYD